MNIDPMIRRKDAKSNEKIMILDSDDGQQES